METETLARRVRAWLRRQPRAVLIPVAFVAAILLLTLISTVRQTLSDSKPARVEQARIAPSAQVTAAATNPMPALSSAPAIKPPVLVVTQPSKEAGSPTQVSLESRQASKAPALQVSAQSSIPPPGIELGWVKSSTFQRDQFGQFARIEATTQPDQLTNFQSQNPSFGGPDWMQTFHGWFQLDAPQTIAILRVAAGAGMVEASIDGQSLGQPLTLSVSPVSETATLHLGKGWHTFLIQASRGGFQRATAGISAQIVLGDGSTPPAPVAPYFLPPFAAGAAPIASGSHPTKPPGVPATSALTQGAGHE